MDVAVVDYFLLNGLDQDCEIDTDKYHVFLLNTMREIAVSSEKGGFIHQSDEEKMRYMSNISRLLDNSSTFVRQKCLNLLVQVIPYSAKILESAMTLLMKKTLCNIGHQEKRVRYNAIQVLFQYLHRTTNLLQFLELFVKHGIKAEDLDNRRASLYALMVIITKDIAKKNILVLIKALACQLVEREPYLFYPTFNALNYLHTMIGEDGFNVYMGNLDQEAVSAYQIMLTSQASKQENSQRQNIRRLPAEELEYGILRKSVVDKLKNDDWHTRNDGLETILKIVKTEDLKPLLPHLRNFLASLSVLLSDHHPIIIFTTSQIYKVLVNKLSETEMSPFLRTIVTMLTVNLGCHKIFREQIICIFQELFQKHQPMPVLKILLEHMKNRDARVREEVINRVTSSLIQFPNSCFDYKLLCSEVGPAIGDKVNRVKVAALECLVALAATLGRHWKIYIQPVVESCAGSNASLAMMIIEEKVRRRNMASCSSDGVVHYNVNWQPSAQPDAELQCPEERVACIASPNLMLQRGYQLIDAPFSNSTCDERDARMKKGPALYLVRTLDMSVLQPPILLEQNTTKNEKVSPVSSTSSPKKQSYGGEEGRCSAYNIQDSDSSQCTCEKEEEMSAFPANESARNEESGRRNSTKKRATRKAKFKRKCCCKEQGFKKERQIQREWERFSKIQIEANHPLVNPKEEFDAAVLLLSASDWHSKKKAMDVIVRVCRFHSQLLKNNLNALVLKLMDEVKSLRSSLSRPAVTTLGEMAKCLRRTVEPVMHPAVALLLQKTGNRVNVWMKEEIENTLSVIIHDAMSPQRAILALISGGATNGSKDVRQTTAKFLSQMVEKLKASKCLSGNGNLTAELLPAAAKFLSDHSPTTRYYARRIFAVLLTHEDFDKYLQRHLPHHAISHITKYLTSIRERGPGQPPKGLYK